MALKIHPAAQTRASRAAPLGALVLSGCAMALLASARSRWLEVWCGDASLGTACATSSLLASLAAGVLLGRLLRARAAARIAIGSVSAAALALAAAELPAASGVVCSLLPAVALGIVAAADLGVLEAALPGRAAGAALAAGAIGTGLGLLLAQGVLLPRLGTRLTLDVAALCTLLTAFGAGHAGAGAARVMPRHRITSCWHALMLLGSAASAAAVMLAQRWLTSGLPPQPILHVAAAVALAVVFALGACLEAWLARARELGARARLAAAAIATAAVITAALLAPLCGHLPRAIMLGLAALSVAAAGTALAALLAAAPATTMRRTDGLATMGAGAALGTALAVLVVPGFGTLGATLSAGDGVARRVLARRQEAGHELAVVEELAPPERRLWLDGTEVQGSGDRHRCLAVAGHLALAVSRANERALLLTLGTGTTASAMASHPLAALTVVEPLRAVVELASWFMPDPGAQQRRVLVDDPRRFLARATASFDAIVIGAPPWQLLRVTRLMTTDCYRLVKARLADGGAFVTTFPVQIEPAALGLLLRSFAAEFESGLLFLVDDTLLALGLAGEMPRLHLEQIAARLRSAGAAGPYLAGAEELLGACIGPAAAAAAALPGSGVMDDAHVIVPSATSPAQAFVDAAANLRALQAARPEAALRALLGGALSPDLDALLASRELLLEGRQLALQDAVRAARTGQAPASRAPARYREALRRCPRDRLAAERLGIIAPTTNDLRAALAHDAKEMLRDWALAFAPELEARSRELLALVAAGEITGSERDRLLERLPSDVHGYLRAALPHSPAPVARALAHVMSASEYRALVRATSDAAILAALVEAAGEQRAADLLDAVLELLDHASAEVRAQAAVALLRITGETFGFDPAQPRTAAAARTRATAWRAQQGDRR